MLSKLKDVLRPVVQYRIRRWNVSMSGYKEENIRLVVNCETDIWYWALAEFVFWNLQTHLCHWLHNIPLPKFFRNWERHWDKDDPEYFAKFEDWYGDDFGCLWHLHVCDPLLRFVWKHKNQDQAAFELTIDEARKKFAHEPQHVAWIEKELAERREYDAERTAETRAKYQSGEWAREQAIDKLSYIHDLDKDKPEEAQQLADILDKATD